MSLRPSIYAADLRKFRASIAGGNAALAPTVVHWLRERDLKMTETDVHRNIDQLLAGVWADKPERHEQVLLVAALAHACEVDAKAAMIHWGNWKIGAYEDYFDAVKGFLPPASITCCDFLLGGRALFGNAMDTDWSYYSYLAKDEVRSLSADFTAAHARFSELDSPDCIHGFPTEFRGWLQQIIERDGDLWLFAE